MNTKFKTLIVTLAVSIAMSFSAVKIARAELVAETDNTAAVNNDDNLHALSPTPNVVEEHPKTTSKVERMRHRRAKEEIKNEDLLAQKIEEMRLKEEMKRRDQINNEGELNGGLTEQVPSTSTDVQPSTNNPATAQSITSVAKEEKEEEPLLGGISLRPRGGLSIISGSVYDVQSKYAVGADVEVSLSDYFAIEGGYTFARYDVTATPSMFITPYSYLYQPVQMNDNVANVGAKAYLLSNKRRIRPFVGGGGAYRMGYVNYDSSTLGQLRASGQDTQDVNLTALSGYLEGGVDFQISHTISLTTNFRYFSVFNSKQSAPINPYGFVNYYGGGAYPASLAYTTDIKSQIGSSLASSNFYQLMAGVSINF